MSNSKKFYNIKKSDYLRVLLTETTPAEMPLIVNNDGFYLWFIVKPLYLALNNNFIADKIFDFKSSNKSDWTIPFKYKINKDSKSFRELSLIHPRSQLQISNIYKKFSSLIIYHCSKSPASIRAPYRIGSLSYVSNPYEDEQRTRTSTVDIESQYNLRRHPSSYFAYRGYNRLYKFFDSKKFLDLECRFSTLGTLDISKCFHNIYTHTIEWATKCKASGKRVSNKSFSFGAIFDKIIQKTNHNETNGINIGPESSRIFAEIILQDIDCRAIEKLKNAESLVFDIDYVFYRYVDDYFIFCLDEIYFEKIAQILEDEILRYNLHINKEKSTITHRPFFTNKSRSILKTKDTLKTTLSMILHECSLDFQGEKFKAPVPIRIIEKDNFYINFIHSLKSSYGLTQEDTQGDSTFIVSCLQRRIQQVTSINNILLNHCQNSSTAFDLLNEKSKTLLNENRFLHNSIGFATETSYLNILSVLLESTLYFYSLSPSVQGSYKVSLAIIQALNFAKANFPAITPSLQQLIYNYGKRFLDINSFKDDPKRENLVSVEKLNILLSLGELDKAFQLSQASIDHIFLRKKYLNYFEIISILFYIKGDPKYINIINKIKDHIIHNLNTNFNLSIEAESTHLFLDIITCPYFDFRFKNKITKLILKKFGKNLNINQLSKDSIKLLGKHYWFTNWSEMNLERLLVRKELIHSY